MSRCLIVYLAILVACSEDCAVAQPSTPSPVNGTEVAKISSIDLIAAPPAELKFRLAPLDLAELEALRTQVWEAVRANALQLADLLVQRMRLDEAISPTEGCEWERFFRRDRPRPFVLCRWRNRLWKAPAGRRGIVVEAACPPTLSGVLVRASGARSPPRRRAALLYSSFEA